MVWFLESLASQIAGQINEKAATECAQAIQQELTTEMLSYHFQWRDGLQRDHILRRILSNRTDDST